MLEQYNFFPIVFTVIIVYLISWGLAKTKKINLLNHRKGWNIFLMICFFTSATLGLILAMASDYRLQIPYYSIVLWIHVEFGIMLFLTALFHFLWHLPYYLNILKIRKKLNK